MICFNKECQIDFTPKTHNQKYCSDECCRIQTNRRIMEKYYEKKAIKNGAVRKCKTCSSKLSRYNDSNVCLACENKKVLSNKKNILRMINEVS
jgi:hypothetical protein